MPELSALRLVKVPDVAPPYDCQLHGTRCPARAAEIVTGPAGLAPAAEVPAAAGPSVAGPSVARPSGAGPSGAGPSGTGPSGTGPARVGPSVAGPSVAGPAGVGPAGAGPAGVGPDSASVWPRRMAVVIVEVLAGVRSDRQLVPLATDRVRARIRGLAPLLACDRQPRIQRIVVSRPAAPVVELTVVADFGQRSRALALRLEHVAARPAAPGWPARPARWLCTAIEAG